MGKQDDHNCGQKDGSEATMFDYLVQDFNPLSSQEYKEGFRHGYANRPEKEFKIEWPKDKPKEKKAEAPSVETKAESQSISYDDYDDYYDYESYDPSPAPKPPPPPKFTYESTHYSENDKGFTKSTTTYEFDTQEEKDAFLEDRKKLELLFFKDNPEHWEREAIARGKQQRIEESMKALESGNPIELLKLLIKKSILG